MQVEANGYRRFLSHVQVKQGWWPGLACLTTMSSDPQSAQENPQGPSRLHLIAQRVQAKHLPAASHVCRDEDEEEQHRAAIGTPDLELWAIWAE